MAKFTNPGFFMSPGWSDTSPGTPEAVTGLAAGVSQYVREYPQDIKQAGSSNPEEAARAVVRLTAKLALDIIPFAALGKAAVSDMLAPEATGGVGEATDFGPGSMGAAERPRLISNLKHHPGSPSAEPLNAAELYDRSILSEEGTRWAQDASGTIHRFSKPCNGDSHWNGSTAGRKPIQPRNIPPDIRKALGVKK